MADRTDQDSLLELTSPWYAHREQNSGGSLVTDSVCPTELTVPCISIKTRILTALSRPTVLIFLHFASKLNSEGALRLSVSTKIRSSDNTSPWFTGALMADRRDRESIALNKLLHGLPLEHPEGPLSSHGTPCWFFLASSQATECRRRTATDCHREPSSGGSLITELVPHYPALPA